ncbi:MAG: hypothetical protein J6Q96_01065 [Bacteroidales bacterium]|nr:hypothetical protein [Bacteroidales bacterium]
MASGTITFTAKQGSGSTILQGKIDWSSKSNGTDANTSTITTKLYARRTDAFTSTPTTGKNWGGRVQVGSNTAHSFSSLSKSTSVAASWVLFATYTDVVKHNDDGTCSVTISGSVTGASGTSLAGTTSSGSKSVTLDKIARQATLTGAPNFNDEENPVITYSNPAGTAVEALQACIADENGMAAYVPYRDISKTGTSYTFNLTDAERETLRKATANSNTLTIKFYIKTTIAGTDYYNSIAKTLTIKNPNPTLNPTAVDANATTKALTGDENKFIKYHSNASFSVGDAAVKNSTIKSRKVVCGAKSSTSASGTLNAVESGTFTFTATDSRGNTTTKTLTKTLINYVKLTCNLTAENPTPDGKMYFKVNGNYFNNTFGAVANTLQVQFRYKENDGAYGSWTDATATKSGNTYSAEVNLTGLNYQSSYTFQARAIDKISTGGVNSAEKRVKAIPVFDWGENDFKFNVDAFDKNGNKLGTEITTGVRSALCISGKELKESGWISITPVANTPTKAKINYKRAYKEIPIITLSCVAGNPEQILGYSLYNHTNTSVEIVLTRTNTAATNIYYFIYGEVAE